MARPSITWVRYSTGIADTGDWRNPARASGPERAKQPISSRATVVTRTRPRLMHPARRGIQAGGEPDQGGLVDQPGDYYLARLITSGSAKSPKTPTKRSRLLMLTGPGGRRVLGEAAAHALARGDLGGWRRSPVRRTSLPYWRETG